MSNLADWQSFLKQKMQALDEIWDLLDDVWKEAPSELTGEITDKADAFYQAYWDLFHAAVENQNINEVQEEVQEALSKAGKEVASAWKIVADFRTQRSENDLTKAIESGLSPLFEPRKSLRDAKAAISEGEKKSTEGNYVASVNKYKECIQNCLVCDDIIGDAWEVYKRERKGSRRGWIQLIVSIILVALVSFLVGKFS